jgi:parallel beta-helix repeat protein
MNVLRSLKCLAALGLLALASPAHAGGGVPISLVADQPAYLVGATVTVRVQMGASGTPVWGGQFFLTYNNADLGFQSVTTGDAPFTTQVYSSASAPNIDYAVGAISGATTPTTMAVLKFTAGTPIPSTSGLVSFRAHTPPTRLTDGDANEVASSPTDLPAISIATWTGTDAWVDDNYAGKSYGDVVNWPDNGLPGPHAIGVDAFATIQGGVNAVSVSGTVHVAAGSYNEDVNVNKDGLSVLGAGATSIVSGPIGGPSSTFALSGNNVTLAGFKITRDGNNLTDWNNALLNSAGVSIQGTGYTGILIRDNLITQMRTGIDINNSSGHTVRNNVVTDNRTGMILRNQTDNLTVAENEITNNWTVGFVFLDGSGGTNSPVQTAANCSFSNNNISGNWYGQIVDRQTGGSLPAPGGSPKNFSANWFGTTSPVITTANSTEPGYSSQIPVEFGGTAVPPGGQPDIAGPASANFDVTPLLAAAVDTNSGAYADSNGFQGDFSHLIVISQGAQTGAAGRVQEGINLIANGFLTGGSRLVDVLAGTYKENPIANKAVTVSGPNAGTAGSAVRGAEAIIVTNGAQPMVFGVTANDVTIDGFTIDGDDPLTTAAAPTYAGTDANTSYGVSNRTPGLTAITRLTVQNNIIKNTYMGVRVDGNGSSAAVANVTRNWFDAIGTFDFGYAISMRNHFYADFTSNKVTRAWTGVHTSINSLASPNPTWNLSNNEMHTYGCGIANWEVDANGTGATIDNNTITVEGGTVQPNNVGIWCYVYQGIGTTTITNNVITGHDIGFLVTGAYNTGANQLTIGGTNSVVGAKVAGVRYANHLNIIASTPTAYLNPAHENPVGTSQLQNYIQTQTGPQLLNLSGLPITGALKDGIVESDSASVSGIMRLNVSTTHADGSSAAGSSGIKVEGSDATASITNNPTTFTGFAYGVEVDGGSALIQTTNLAGNTVAGIRVLNGGKVDAGDCSASNYTGLGSSTGGNTLTGYSFDNSAPWAVQDDNAAAQFNVLAQNNDYGAGFGNNIADLVQDSADNAALSTVVYSQNGGQAITAAVVSNDYCNYAVPSSVTFTATYAGPGTIEWRDGTCGGALIGTGNPFLWTSPPSTAGVHTYYARVDDGCAVQCGSTTITVHAAPVITANVNLSGISSGTFTRCISFDLFSATSCPAAAYSHEETVTFVNGSATAVFNAPCGTYTCITARDRLHTLRRTIDAGNFLPSGNDYTVNFTGTDALISGNVNDDNFIDILDFGGFIGRFGLSDAPGGTNCSTTGRHPDFSGDGNVGSEDFGFISFNFLAAREPDCCSNPLAEGRPTLEISVTDLARTDYEMARTADLNRDGLLNTQDVNFLSQHGFARCPADFYADGTVDIQDIFIFLNNWFSGFPAADFNDDHVTGVDDIFEFLNVWFQGC